MIEYLEFCLYGAGVIMVFRLLVTFVSDRKADDEILNTSSDQVIFYIGVLSFLGAITTHLIF